MTLVFNITAFLWVYSAMCLLILTIGVAAQHKQQNRYESLLYSYWISILCQVLFVIPALVAGFLIK